MKNKERAHLEARHKKKLESLKEEVTRFTNLLEQALGSKLKKATFTAQPSHMPTTSFNA